MAKIRVYEQDADCRARVRTLGSEGPWQPVGHNTSGGIVVRNPADPSSINVKGSSAQGRIVHGGSALRRS